METTADRIRSVVKSLLPERPHHLSLYPDRKYVVPPNYWQHQTPLQYSTFLSDADRGVLLTRPYFDICDEPETSPTTPLPSATPKKMTKMSIKDYKKAKQVSHSSNSPIENGVPGRPNEKSHTGDAVRLDKETMRKEYDSSREAGSQQSGKAQRANGDTERSRYSASKPTSRDAPSPPESKKRPLDPDDSARPHKKARPSEDLPRRPPRPETPHSSSAHDKASSSKEGRSGGSQLTPGGRAASGSSRERDRAVSPRITVNGTKTSSSSQSNPLPRKPDSSGKHLVPPLLSPLRHPAIDDELETDSPKKRPKENPSGGKAQTKAPKPEATVRKKQPAMPELPALLSPTLPPMVEDELLRLEKVAIKGEPGQAVEGTKSTRKEKTREGGTEEGRPKSLIVTLKIRKTLRPTVRRLLALPSKNRKDRSASVEAAPPPAKKKPRPTEAPTEAPPSIAAKRPTSKAPDTPAAVKAPYTPPNPPATVSQVPSGSSQNLTPGGRVAQTPSAAAESGPPRASTAKDRETLMRRHGAMSVLGRNLKRERDKEKQERDKERHKQPNGTTANGERMAAEDYRPVMLTMEMILAYFIAFRSQNQACELSRTHVDEKAWLSLEAHLRELRHMTYHSLPLHTLAVQLNGILINEILKVYAFNSNASREFKLDEGSQKILLRNVNHQFVVWSEAERFRNKLADERLKTPVMGPWTSPYKAAADTLAVMARVADREHVDWRAEVVPPKD